MKPKAIGLVELARIAGVSAATVSRALANNPNVADATRARIAALAHTHGFQLNHTASAFRKQRTQAIAVTIPLGHETDQSLSDPFFMALIGPLADALARAGYDMLLSRVIPTGEGWLDALLHSGRADGVIVIGQSNQVDVIEAAARHHRNLLIWGARVGDMAQLTVGTDNVAGGRMAGEHLLRIGRRRLAFLGNPDVPEFAARLAGFRAAIDDAPGDTTQMLLPVHLTNVEAYREIIAFLSENPTPDGIFAASDVIALSAMQAIAERGLSVPDDVAVIGYDDVMIARYANPPLTTVRQDVVAGAQMLVRMLLDRMAGAEVAPVEMVPELVLRGSA